VHAVATSAVREADNRREFVRRALAEAEVRVAVISGAEEARLIRLGALQAVPAYDRRHLLIDIGGGSTEFVIGERDEVLGARSLKLGAIRLTERFGLDLDGRAGPLKRKTLDECRQFIRSYLAPVQRMVEAFGFDVVIGSSGTIVNLLQISRARAGDAPLRQVSGATLAADALDDVVEVLAACSSVDRRRAIDGLEPKRADIVLGGALVLEQAMALLGVGEIVISDFALREGVLLDVLRRRERTSIGHLRDLRYESVMHLAALAPDERDHAQQSTELALRLFEQTTELHGLDASYEELLEAAGLLANVGLVVSHDRHHLHSYYVIRNAEALTGFTDEEVELIALVARYHRKSAPKPTHPEFAALSSEQQRIVRILAGFLRIGVALDRTRTQAVRDLTVAVGKRQVTIHLVADGDAALERYTANARTALLGNALGVDVVVQ
jgi:exopolyphosphatase/guanosine-5'-triphosphate,3'-diphosphate pyrophosphatase